MLVNATEMLIKARDGHYGVPQFNKDAAIAALTAFFNNNL